jgi:hypothetical protein
MTSRRSYSFLSKAFLVNDADRERIAAMASRNRNRYTVGIIMIFWGLVALAWVFGWNFIL